MSYELTWITPSLAVGYAPMSYAELEAIEKQGIDAIVNLCGEFCDLHEIEEKSGFEVYFLPIPDENAPDMAEMEKALEWLDESLYLGKKVLVHCRHGIGRTGTFVSAYLIRRGLGLKVAEKTMKGTRANPTNYAQWSLLRKYGKKSGKLTIREPSLESKNTVDLADFFAEYEALVKDVENTLDGLGEADRTEGICGLESDNCCRQHFSMKLIEALYLFNKMNTTFPSSKRQATIERAAEVFQEIRVLVRDAAPTATEIEMNDIYRLGNIVCPLSVEGKCSLYAYRPIRCRSHGVVEHALDSALHEDILSNISRNVFFALSNVFPGEDELLFSCPDIISGRFTQVYFHYLSSR
ncbi:MAG: dual specificity protein phosphatase family protein [Proteobacteria bacterium]|nr:dual specificity protein phosphatase family protein [Pseudomonadota bacterium]MBU1641450.1 dual specificity protein phosphatase family protein [Pseudomonadota bacterium]